MDPKDPEYTRLKKQIELTQDFNLSPKNITILGEIIGGQLIDIDLSTSLLDCTPKTKSIKAKANK